MKNIIYVSLLCSVISFFSLYCAQPQQSSPRNGLPSPRKSPTRGSLLIHVGMRMSTIQLLATPSPRASKVVGVSLLKIIRGEAQIAQHHIDTINTLGAEGMIRRELLADKSDQERRDMENNSKFEQELEEETEKLQHKIREFKDRQQVYSAKSPTPRAQKTASVSPSNAARKYQANDPASLRSSCFCGC